jgi:adenosylcobinamide kinase/adenosylcobinamide-phosphate guanylyltransferase
MIHLVTGGARAGKSRWALAQAEATPAAAIAFVATAQPLDAEMEDRILRHRAERSPRWITVEEPLALDTLLPALPQGAIVVDCLTLWVCNLLFADHGTADAAEVDARVEARVDALAAALAHVRVPTWLVTNEVGLGIVPGDPLSRRYRDLLGRCNQRVAAAADHVTFVVSGLPMHLK